MLNCNCIIKNQDDKESEKKKLNKIRQLQSHQNSDCKLIRSDK